MRFPDDVTKEAQNRLRRAEGQLRGVQRLLEEGADCRDVVTQISAVQAALHRAGLRLMASGMRHCIVNPEVDANWMAEPVVRAAAGQTVASRIRHWVLWFTRRLFSQSVRNRSLDVVPLLRCPDCDASAFSRQGDHIACGSCSARFDYRNDVLIMAKKAAH